MSSPIPIEQQPEQATQPEQAQQVEGQAAKPRRNLRKSKDQESAGIENFELPKSTVTKLAKEAVCGVLVWLSRADALLSFLKV